MLPKGELVSMGTLGGVMGRFRSHAKLVDTYEQVAPESNSTEALDPCTKNIPYTMLGAFWASSMVRWVRQPWVGPIVGLCDAP